MIAVILAAGMASRLRPLTNDRPKCLLEIGHRSLLQRTFDALTSNGVQDFVIVTGYRNEMIQEFLTRHYAQVNLRFVNNADYRTTNNIYSLWLAMSLVKGEEFLLLDSDILFDPEIITRVLATQGSTLTVNCHNVGEEEMKIMVDTQGIITGINKTCRPEDAIGESIGIERISADYSTALYRELKQMIETEQLTDIFYERAFERLIPQGHSFSVIDVTDLFSMELDTVEDFNNAKEIIPQHLY